MTVFSGRFDMYDTEEECLTWFLCFIEQFNCTDIILAFEDKTKTSIPCKPHYHFLFRCDATHDTLRRNMSKNKHLKGNFSSIKETDNYDKAACYTLKQFPIQEYVPFYDFGKTYERDLYLLVQYIDQSAQYQEKLTLNTWKDHMGVIIENIKNKYTKQFPSRLDLFNLIYEYIFDWNQNKEAKHINTPTNIKKDISYIESQVLPKKEFMCRMLLDNQHLIYDHEIKERAYEMDNLTQITKIRTAHKAIHFIDSDEESDCEITNLDL